MADDKIRYSDLIEPDDSFEKLIAELGDVEAALEVLREKVTNAAKGISSNLKTVVTVTYEGKKAIEDLADASSDVASADKSLTATISAQVQAIEKLKSSANDVTTSSKEQIEQIEKLRRSYEMYRTQLLNNVKALQALEGAEKDTVEYGKYLADNIKTYTAAVNTLQKEADELAESMKEAKASAEPGSYIALSNELRNLETRFNSMSKAAREAYGKDLVERMKAVREEMKGISQEMKGQTGEPVEKNATATRLTAIERARQKLAAAESSEARELAELNKQIRDANKMTELQVRFSNAARGSYEQLSAQYEINKIKLNQMSAEERNAVGAGQALEEETFKIYQQMKRLQETTGNNRLNVGGYTQVWDGLSFSVTQVVRELPAAAVSLNTFFLAISNNIPMVVDEIKKLQAANEAAIRSGGKATSVVGKIVKSLFSWQTVLVLVLAAFSKYGKEILEFCNSVLHGMHVIQDSTHILRSVRKEVRNQTEDLGKQVAQVRILADEWSRLRTDAEKTQWIKDNKTEFDKLHVSVKDINDAENVFVKNTEAVIRSLTYRAIAAAGTKLAAEEYAKAFQKLNKANELMNVTEDLKYLHKDRADRLKMQAQEYMQNAKQYLDLTSQYSKLASNELKNAGIEEDHKDIKTSKGKDVSDYIDRTRLRLKKMSDDLIEGAIVSELDKREKQILDSFEETQMELLNIFNKNQRILRDNSKKLTAEQVKALRDMNDSIVNADYGMLTENYAQYVTATEQLALDRSIAELKRENETSQLKIEAMKENSEEEFELRKSMLENNMRIEIAENNKLVESEQQSEFDIRAKWMREIEKLELQHRNKINEIRKTANDLLISTTGSYDIRNLQALLDNADIEYTTEINANRDKADGSQVNELAIFEKYRRKKLDILAKYYSERFQQAQEADEAEFNEIKRSEFQITRFQLEQEQERLQFKLDLQRDGYIQLSDDEIRLIKANLKRISRELKENNSNLFSDGLESGLLQLLGFDKNAIAQFDAVKQTIIAELQDLFSVEEQLIQQQIDLQQKRVDATKTAYEYEMEARANGYANSAAVMKKELQMQESTLRKKQAMMERYQQQQLALETAQQASSLVTATAKLWSATADIPIVGPILAAVATAGMFAAFVASKVRASQLTSTYGKGGLEILEGGSHASGHDINLGVKNGKGRTMKAEGGEALVVLNKRNTRKYKSILPDLVNSLNSGVFEDRYMQQSQYEQMPTSITDLSRLERGVDRLVAMGNTRAVELGDKTIIYTNNVKRIIKHN